MGSNAKTLATYSAHFSDYIDGTVQVTSGFQKDWLDFLLNHYSKESEILEVGSAFGRDASYIVSQGYVRLLTSDAFPEAVVMLHEKGFRAETLDLLSDAIDGTYDLIIASAVFLHFTVPEFSTVLAKLHDALTADGRLGFSVKEGVGEEWSDAKMGAPRFFHYWRTDELRDFLIGAGYEIVDFRQSDDGKWLHVTCSVNET